MFSFIKSIISQITWITDNNTANNVILKYIYIKWNTWKVISQSFLKSGA